MERELNINAYSDALVVLGTAAILVPILRRWGISPILSYLAAGALLGPLGLGSFVTDFPPLYWLTVTDAKNVAAIAELGIVFLLFLIGLGLPFGRLMTMRRLVFGLGTLQILLSATVISGVAVSAGQTAAVAAVLGLTLSLSSTAIVLELLSNQQRLNTTVGRTSFSILLAQDLAVVPILLFVSILSTSASHSVLASLGQALFQAALAIFLIIGLGRFLVRPLFQQVARTRSNELFIAAVLFVIVSASVIGFQAGLSMGLGAFIAGLLLAETEYGKAIENTVEPFKGLLLGAFFFTVGMTLDLREVVSTPGWLAGVICLVGVKFLVLLPLARMFRVSWASSLETSLLLSSGGEFAFVGIGMAAHAGLIEGRVSNFALAVTSLTMAMAPMLAALGRAAGKRLAENPNVGPELLVLPRPERQHAIVVGHGRVGKVVCSLLSRHGVRYVAVDHDAAGVSRDRREGREVFYGDAGEPGFLDTCGLADARGVIITIHSYASIDQIVDRVRQARPDVLIVARARDEQHARHLYAIGATDAVPETLEASLQLAEAALVGLGIPTGSVIASVHEKRDEFRRLLQDAARQAGRSESRSIKARTR